MNSPTAEMIKAARKGAEVARYLRWGPTIEGRHLMNAVAAYEEVIEALQATIDAKVFDDYDPPGSDWHDETIYEARCKVEAVLAKAKETEG